MQNGRKPDDSNYVPALDDTMGTVWQRMRDDAGILDETARDGFGGFFPRGVENSVSSDGEILGPQQQLQRDIVSRIKRTPFGPFRRYLSDVLACNDSREANRIARQVIRTARDYPGNLCLVSTHDDHVHVVHDCAYSDGSCRCKILKEETVKAKRRGAIRKRKAISTISSDQWDNIVIYFISNGRWLQFAKVGGSVVGLPYGYQALQERGHQGQDSGQILGTCTSTGSSELCGESSTEETTRSSTRINSRNGRRRRRCASDIREEMEKIVNENPVCPLAGIISTRQWLTHKELRYLRADNETVKSFLDAKSEEMCYWTLHDFNAFYSQPYCNPTFMAGYQPLEDKYYSINDSLTILNKLLAYQFDDDVVQIKSFLTTFYNILERKLPKCNTICVWSPPSAGKNFFFDVYLHYLMNYGQLGIMNKTNNFSLQEATSKRVLLWNEPNYEDAYTDTLKMLTGGDALCVRVKQKKDCHVYKTPLIVLTNNMIGFMHEIAFVDRVKVYKWKQAPFLAEYNKKPNPLVAFEIMVYWEIIPRVIEQ